MSILINITAIITGIVLIGTIFNLMVNRKMTEAQSVLWIVMGITAIALGICPRLINIIADKLGVWYAPSLAFLIAYLTLLFIVLKTTVITSVQNNQINELFMEIVLIKKENEDLKKQLRSLNKECEFD